MADYATNINTSNYIYRKPLVVSETSGQDRRNVLLRIEIDNVDFNFYLARTDGKDFRLCERANGSGCLNMFIARWDYTNKRAYLYFKLPFLGANEDRTLYAFWGNKFDSGMSDLSSLSDCFIFYDDFNTLDTSKWIASSVSGTAYTISNSQISIATGHYITPGDSNPPFVDTISGGTASADSTANPASNACDNNLSTYWRTVFPVSYPHWWKYDFGAGITKTIQSVSIRQDIASNGVRIAIFQGSNDNTNWDDLTSRQLPNNNLKFIFSFPNSTAYRYYRLYCVVGWGYSSDTAGIIEIEFSESYVPEDSSNLVLNGKTSWIIEEGFVGKTGVTSTSYYAHRHLFLTGTTGYNPFDFRYYWNGSINRSHSVVNGSTLVTYTGTGVQGMEQNVFNYNILAYWEDTDYVYQGMKFRNTLPDYFEGWERSVLGNTELTSFRIYDDENGAAQGVLLDWFILRDYDLHLEPLYDVSNLYVPFEDVPVPPLDFTVYGYDVTSTDFHHETTFSGANAVLISDNIADSAPNTFIGNALSGNIVIDFGRYNDDLTSDQLIHFDNNHVTYYNASKLSNNDLNAYGRNYWLCTVSSGVWAAIDFDTPEIVSTLVVQAVSTKLSGMIKNYNFYGSDRDPRYYTSSRVKLAYGVFLSVPYEQTIHFNNSNPYRYYILEAVDTYGGVVALQEWQMFRSSTESRPMVVGQLRLHPLVAESSDYYFPKYIKLLASNDKYNWTTLTKSSLDYIPDEVIDATDIAYNKPTYASSYYYHITENYTSGRAVDGNDNTMWSSNEGTPPHWWSVDLLSTYNIRKIEVLARPGYSNLQSYEFYISTDNVNWQLFHSVSQIPYSTKITVLPIIFGRYIKINVTQSGWYNGMAFLSSVNVYATSNPNLDTEYATYHKTYTPFYDSTYGRWQRISLTNDRSYYYYKLECAGNWGGEDSKIKIAEWEMVERIELEAKTYRIMAGTLSNFTNVWPAEESTFENPIFYATNDMFNMIGNYSVMKSSTISGSLDMIVRY